MLIRTTVAGKIIENSLVSGDWSVLSVCALQYRVVLLSVFSISICCLFLFKGIF